MAVENKGMEAVGASRGINCGNSFSASTDLAELRQPL
jgi:hypothetical protein